MLPVQRLEWNRTDADYPRDSTVAEQFKRRAALTPDAVALIYKDRRLTYREVDERSDGLALRLQARGVKPEMLVGVLMGRSENLVLGILAILKAGGAYVPLDRNYPHERLSYVLQDSGIDLIVTSREIWRDDFPGHDVLFVDADAPSAISASSVAVLSGAEASNLAYVLYTSGSTGPPKGVMVEHRNVVSFFAGMDRAIGSAPGVWLAVTSVVFDISVLEILWTLTRGFQVVMHGDEDTGSIADEIRLRNVTHLQMTPSLAQMLVLDEHSHSALGQLRQILLGGEAVPASLISRLREFYKGEIYNMYGPTETTIWSTTYSVLDFGQTVPIGRPIANTQVFLLDEDLNPVRAGEPGEIFIGGDGVSRGYWNRPELTVERFLKPASLRGQRVYRTGDVARFLGDGNLEFIGRTDHQIKLRGHRIEPGEIEALLERQTGVRQAVVVVREDRRGDKRLVAYLVADRLEEAGVGKLKRALAASLPEVMIPSAFVWLPSLPLTENRKIDRKALLDLPPPDVQETAPLSEHLRESQSDVEGIIREAWKDALGLTSVGLDQNFFDAGAHSLTVAEVQAKLQSALKREIPIVDLFEFPTIASLSRHLGGTESASGPARSGERARRRKIARLK